MTNLEKEINSIAADFVADYRESGYEFKNVSNDADIMNQSEIGMCEDLAKKYDADYDTVYSMFKKALIGASYN